MNLFKTVRLVPTDWREHPSKLKDWGIASPYNIESYIIYIKFFENYDHVSKGDFGPKKLILVQKVDFDPFSKGKYSGPKSPFKSNSYT